MSLEEAREYLPKNPNRQPRTGDEKCKCPLCNCSKYYMTKQSLRFHMKNQHKEYTIDKIMEMIDSVPNIRYTYPKRPKDDDKDDLDGSGGEEGTTYEDDDSLQEYDGDGNTIQLHYPGNQVVSGYDNGVVQGQQAYYQQAPGGGYQWPVNGSSTYNQQQYSASSSQPPHHSASQALTSAAMQHKASYANYNNQSTNNSMYQQNTPVNGYAYHSSPANGVILKTQVDSSQH